MGGSITARLGNWVGQDRGVLLHTIIKRTPGLTHEWMEHIAQHVDIAVHVHFMDVYDSEGLALCLIKQLTDSAIVNGWPHRLRPATMPRGWCLGCPLRGGGRGSNLQNERRTVRWGGHRSTGLENLGRVAS